MSEIVSLTPRIVGIEPKPPRRRGSDEISKEAVIQLPDVPQEKSLVIEYPSIEELKAGRKRILTQGMRFFGSGRIITRSINNRLYLWIKDADREIVVKIRDHEAKYGNRRIS
jgi:hypothetical protein